MAWPFISRRVIGSTISFLTGTSPGSRCSKPSGLERLMCPEECGCSTRTTRIIDPRVTSKRNNPVKPMRDGGQDVNDTSLAADDGRGFAQRLPQGISEIILELNLVAHPGHRRPRQRHGFGRGELAVNHSRNDPREIQRRRSVRRTY